MWRVSKLTKDSYVDYDELCILNEFEEYFANINQSWFFAKPDDTSKLLGEIG